MGQEKVWSTKRLTILCFGSLNSVEIGLHWKLTTHTTEIVQSNAVLSYQGGHQCPVGPIWARKRFVPPKDIPCSVLELGSLYSVGIGMHWKLTTHTTEIVQKNLPQSQDHQCPSGADRALVTTLV